MFCKYHQKAVLLFNVLLLSTSLSASSLEKEELTSFSSSSSSSSINTSPMRKRSAEHLGNLSESPIKKQIFARATYDSTAKYLLSNDQVRLDFVQTFSGLTNIASTQQLGSALNPLQELTGLRELLADTNTLNFMKAVKSNSKKFVVMEKDPSGGGDYERVIGSQFIRGMSRYFDDMLKVFPNQERASQLDVVCRLSTGELALIEIQVKKENYWDKRALAYLAGVYSRQLREGEGWDELKRVIGINILGGGPNNVAYWKDKSYPVRHYRFQDEYDATNIIPMMELYQYSLGDADLDSPTFTDSKKLRDWLEFFKDVHNKDTAPVNTTPALQQAYELGKRSVSVPPSTFLNKH